MLDKWFPLNARTCPWLAAAATTTTTTNNNNNNNNFAGWLADLPLKGVAALDVLLVDGLVVGTQVLVRARRACVLHQTCDFSEHATSAAAEFGGEIHNVSRKRTQMQVLLQAQKLHVYRSVTVGAFWDM